MHHYVKYWRMLLFSFCKLFWVTVFVSNRKNVDAFARFDFDYRYSTTGNNAQSCLSSEFRLFIYTDA